MKKIHLIFAGMLVLATTMVSCSSEDSAGKENAPAFEFAKTSEMVNFEGALKDYMIRRQQGGAKSKSVDATAMKEKTVALLNSIGKSELASQEAETEQLVLVAMREYSKKLTEMYNQRNTNQNN